VKLAGFTDAASKETQPEELDYLDLVNGQNLFDGANQDCGRLVKILLH
jgi:hypothetical protein